MQLLCLSQKVVARTPEFSADVLGGMPSVNRDQIRMLIIAGDLHIPCFGEEDAAVQGRGEGVRPAFGPGLSVRITV
jgi:hypothetical protein